MRVTKIVNGNMSKHLKIIRLTKLEDIASAIASGKASDIVIERLSSSK